MREWPCFDSRRTASLEHREGLLAITGRLARNSQLSDAPEKASGNSRLSWRTKSESCVILASWVASGHHRFGSGTQERFAANARLLFRLLIEEASGSVNDAQE